jgi:hypothetical protein
MSDGGKGSRARPFSVPKEVFDGNFDAIFKKENKMQVRANPEGNIGTCGCGRSPSGNCCGWHALSEDEYRVKLAEHEDTENKKANNERTLD